jgi:hypothetical protein
MFALDGQDATPWPHPAGRPQRRPFEELFLTPA